MMMLMYLYGADIASSRFSAYAVRSLRTNNRCPVSLVKMDRCSSRSLVASVNLRSSMQSSHLAKGSHARTCTCLHGDPSAAHTSKNQAL